MSPPFATVGPIFECHPSFPQKINAEFVQVSRVSNIYPMYFMWTAFMSSVRSTARTSKYSINLRIALHNKN